jgi:hypothetical protein
VKDETGRVHLAINILHDITQQRRDERRMTLLTGASAILSTVLDFDKMLRQLARLPVPRLAGWCVLDVHDGDRLRRFVVHGDASQAELVARLEACVPARDGQRDQAHAVGRPGHAARGARGSVRAILRRRQRAGHRARARGAPVRSLLARA